MTGRAARDELYTVEAIDPREFATDKHGTVDDRPYGGGPGMVMKAPMLSQSVKKAKALLGEDALVIAMSPQGVAVDEAMISRLVATRRSFLSLVGMKDSMSDSSIAKLILSCRWRYGGQGVKCPLCW